jgi:hypothetical protein
VNGNHLIRQGHRWLSIAFTLAVVVNVVALAQQAQSFWIGLLALVPLILLMLSGLVLFCQPYVARWRGRPAPHGRRV